MEPYWQEVIDTTKECINAIDEDNSDVGEETEELNFALDLIKIKWEQFLSLEAEIKRKTNNSFAEKNVINASVADEATSSEVKTELTPDAFITVMVKLGLLFFLGGLCR